MKTGIVMEIDGRDAVVMVHGGDFVRVKAAPAWRKGNVVALPVRKPVWKPLIAAAACLVLLVAGIGYTLWAHTDVALISLDINPSLELTVGRDGKVQSVRDYNDDAAVLLAALDLPGMLYRDAVVALLESDDMQPYLEANEYLDVAVYAKSGEAQMLAALQELIGQAATPYAGLKTTCTVVDAQTVQSAHSHGMSAGKYRAFRELQALDPAVSAEEYVGCGIGQIHDEIQHRHRNGNGQGQGNGSSDETSSQTTSSGQQHGQGHGGHGYQGGKNDNNGTGQ